MKCKEEMKMANVYKFLTVLFALVLIALIGSSYFVSAGPKDPWKVGNDCWDIYHDYGTCKEYCNWQSDARDWSDSARNSCYDGAINVVMC